MISSNVIVPYRDRRLCSGAIFPVRLAKRQGGSARMVAKRRPSAKRNNSSWAVDNPSVLFAPMSWPGLIRRFIFFARGGSAGLAPSAQPGDDGRVLRPGPVGGDPVCPLVFDIAGSSNAEDNDRA